MQAIRKSISYVTPDGEAFSARSDANAHLRRQMLSLSDLIVRNYAVQQATTSAIRVTIRGAINKHHAAMVAIYNSVAPIFGADQRDSLIEERTCYITPDGSEFASEPLAREHLTKQLGQLAELIVLRVTNTMNLNPSECNVIRTSFCTSGGLDEIVRYIAPVFGVTSTDTDE